MILSTIKMWWLLCVWWWSKIFFFRACMKEAIVLTFLILGFIFDHVFNHVFALYSFSTETGMSNVIYLELYLKSESLNILWIYLGTIPFQRLKTLFAIQCSNISLAVSQIIFLKCNESTRDLGGKFKPKQIHLFWTFLKFDKFFFNRGKHEEVIYHFLLLCKNLPLD